MILQVLRPGPPRGYLGGEARALLLWLAGYQRGANAAVWAAAGLEGACERGQPAG
jgi:hypothetical protein